MAQFDANIVVTAAVDRALKDINKIEKAIQSLDTNIKFSAKNSVTSRVRQEVKDLGRSFNILSAAVTKTAEAGAFLRQNWINLSILLAGTEVSNAVSKFLGLNKGLEGVASSLIDAANSAAVFAAQNTLLTGGIAAATVGLVAFGPQLARIAGDLDLAAKKALKLGTAAGRAKNPIKELLNVYSEVSGAFDDAFFEGNLPDVTAVVEAYRKALREVSETVSELGRRQSKLQSTLDQFNSGSATAEKIAGKLVQVTARYNEELREQADLLRRVKGLSQTQLEESKGVKSIETRRRREDFLTRQAREAEMVQKSLLKLAEAQAEVDNARLNARAEQEQIRQEQMVRAANDETIKSLERRLAIEEKIANVRSSRAARTASDAAQRQERSDTARAGFRAEGAGRASAFAKLQQVENKAKLDAARLTQQLTGEQIAQNRVIAEAKARFEQTIAANKEAAATEKERLAALNASTAASKKNATEARRQARKERGKRLESLALGAGFPLLFGGGAGSVIGSALGSFVGTGFGGQIIGGAIGQSIDNLLQSVGKLGQAFNALTPDVNRLVEAAGLAGTSTGELIKSIEQAEGAQKAQALAAEQMAVFVGKDGVQALKDAGDAASELGREASQAFTALAVALAPALEAVADFLARNLQEQRQLSRVDPGVFGIGTGDLAGREDVQQVRRDFESRVIDEPEARARLLAIVREIEKVEQSIFDTRLQSYRTLTESYDQVRQQFELSQNELEIARLGGDLKEESVYQAEKNNIVLQFAIKYQQLLNKEVETEADRRIINLKLLALENQELAALAGLESRRNKALNGGSVGGGIDKEAQTLRTLAGLKTKAFELDTKLITIGDSKIGKLQTELQRLDQVQALKAAEINLSEEDQRIKDAKLALLSKEYSLLYQQKELQLERLKIEERIADIKARQANDNLQAQLDQELAGLTLPSGSSFLDEQNALQVEQANRYANVMRDINDQLEVQRDLATNSDKEISDAANKRIAQLERQRDIYSTMLPQIAKAEREQLRFNQTLSLVEGPVNAFVNGLTEGLQGIIDGTMSAEEAFANMLKGMADALIQTAAQMIAQYIAIGIAKAFAGMGSGTNTFGSEGVQIQNDFGNFFRGAISGRADGGSVAANKPYIVGERGPELFVPNSGGRVINNADSRAALDRYTPNSSYNYSPQLSITTGPVMQMNNEDYIRREDFERGLRQATADGAKRGEAMTLKRLKNSRSTRSTLGM